MESKNFLQDLSQYQTPESAVNRLFSVPLLNFWCFYPWLAKLVYNYRSQVLQQKDSDESWAETSQRILNRVENCGARVTISGLQHLRSLKKPAVFIANHMGTMETLVLPGIIQPFLPVTFVVKSGLIRGSGFAPIMRSRNPVVVNRSDPREDLKTVLTEGTDRISSGISIIIFPQGTRTEGFASDKFNSLGIKLARKSGALAVPIALKTDFWENGRILRSFGRLRPARKVHFEFGPPVSIKGNGRSEHEFVREFIRKKLNLWKEAEK